jgi:Gpi18-like mannosyltransferase
LLLLILGNCRWRFVAAASYWLNPPALIFAAYHGNTDSAIAFFLMLCVWLCSKQKLLAAAIALGVSMWIKLPTILAIPAFTVFIPKWRERLHFLVITAIVALASYLPWLIQDLGIIWKNVFGYRAQLLHTTAGIPTWGPSVLLFSIIAPPQDWPLSFRPPVIFFLENSWLVGLGLVVLLVWLRRSRREISELCATIG